MKVLLSLIVCWTLVSAGMTIRCYSSRKNGTVLKNCESYLKKCASISYSQTLYHKNKEGSDKKLCAPRYCVTGEIGFNSSNGKHFHMNTRCCDTNDCNTDFVELPAREPNGMMCPSCFVYGKGECFSTEDITCNSAETLCVEFTGSITLGYHTINMFTMEGCATPGFCDVIKRSFENDGKPEKAALYVTIQSSKALCYPALPVSETDLE